MLGQTVARHFAEVFVSTVWSSYLVQYSTCWEKKECFLYWLQLRLQLAADFANELSSIDQFLNDSACSTGIGIGSWQRFFSPGKETVAVKTAMKRPGNRI